jgi:predicted PurR-regulated permease PerM
MARKRLADIVIVLIIFSFILSFFTYAILSFDDNIQKNNFLSNNLNTLNNNLSSRSSDLSRHYISQTDLNSDYSSTDGTAEVETRGTDSLSLQNLISKNVLTGFLTKTTEVFPMAQKLINFLIVLIVTLISILFIRSFWGETKV